jgi:23S rRNA pseudoU1915 N3-methylase RlmH
VTTLLAVGRVRPPFVEGEAHYRRLLSRYQPIEVVEQLFRAAKILAGEPYHY